MRAIILLDSVGLRNVPNLQKPFSGLFPEAKASPVQSQAHRTETAPLKGFVVSSVPQSGLANGPMSGPHSCTDALTDKPARELASGITGTRQKGNMRLVHDTDALEIEARPYGCGSRKMAEAGTGFPLGLFYG